MCISFRFQAFTIIIDLMQYIKGSASKWINEKDLSKENFHGRPACRRASMVAKFYRAVRPAGTKETALFHTGKSDLPMPVGYSVPDGTRENFMACFSTCIASLTAREYN